MSGLRHNHSEFRISVLETDVRSHLELQTLMTGSKAGLVFVTAVPDRKTLAKYLGVVAWETEVWVAENPTHLIHFNGERFLGPYSS